MDKAGKSELNVEGEHFLHRELWQVVKRQLEHASSNFRGSRYDDLVAMVFALHTLEAYLNFAGERLAPEIWKDEREYFKKEPYRGFQGKLKKVIELAGLPEPNEETRPYSTIKNLKELRDLIAHAKPERIGPILMPEDGEMFYPTALDDLVAPGKAQIAKEDIEQFVELLHQHAKSKVNDIWFRGNALSGPLQWATKAHRAK